MSSGSSQINLVRGTAPETFYNETRDEQALRFRIPLGFTREQLEQLHVVVTGVIKLRNGGFRWLTKDNFRKPSRPFRGFLASAADDGVGFVQVRLRGEVLFGDWKDVVFVAAFFGSNDSSDAPGRPMLVVSGDRPSKVQTRLKKGERGSAVGARRQKSNRAHSWVISDPILDRIRQATTIKIIRDSSRAVDDLEEEEEDEFSEDEEEEEEENLGGRGKGPIFGKGKVKGKGNSYGKGLGKGGFVREADESGALSDFVVQDLIREMEVRLVRRMEVELHNMLSSVRTIVVENAQSLRKYIDDAVARSAVRPPSEAISSANSANLKSERPRSENGASLARAPLLEEDEEEFAIESVSRQRPAGPVHSNDWALRSSLVSFPSIKQSPSWSGVLENAGSKRSHNPFAIHASASSLVSSESQSKKPRLDKT